MIGAELVVDGSSRKIVGDAASETALQLCAARQWWSRDAETLRTAVERLRGDARRLTPPAKTRRATMWEVTLPATVEEKLVRFRALLDARFGARLRELIVFGSYARGEAHEDSDLDVLVVIDDLIHAEKAEVSAFAYDVDSADGDTWVGLAPVVMSAETAAEMRRRERLLFKDIDREGLAR